MKNLILLALAFVTLSAQAQEVYYRKPVAAGRDFRKELTGDGLLPNDKGYAVMAPLVERAIAQALANNQ